MDDVYDFVRKIEFNRTEPETLAKLMERSVEEGSTERDNLRELNKEAKRLLPFCKDEGLLKVEVLGAPPKEILNCLVGIDGSCQQVGGAGGTWYIFVSAAQVIFPNGLHGKPEVLVDADIARLQERDFERVSARAMLHMHSVENKAIASWASRQTPSVVLLDGPIADPPAYDNEAYITKRCQAIRACLNQEIPLIGFVKRSSDSQFVRHCTTVFKAKRPELSGILTRFPTDTYLLGHLMTLALYESKERSCYAVSAGIDISESTKILKRYLEQGVAIAACYLMLNLGSPLVRLEVAVPSSSALATERIAFSTKQALDIALHSIYPRQQIPLPVWLAHEKCNIRRGCAEVLYEEIMTAQLASDPISQILLSKLRESR